jgi:glycosyltransferase involved in cell wall biosynthesis
MNTEIKEKLIKKYLSARRLYPPMIDKRPESGTNMIVVIPSYKENRLMDTLSSLETCLPTQHKIEVIVVINHRMNECAEIRNMHLEQIQQLNNRKHQVPIHSIFLPDMPIKKGGVGYARKVGMDEALTRFHKLQNSDGVIVCLDADCMVNEKYLISLENYYLEQPKVQAAICHYEHPLDVSEFERDAIMDYEIHLRLLSSGLRWTGHPHAIQTIGSTMTIRAGAYAAHGGMNTRQAGEDFYFLQKLIKAMTVGTIPDAVVHPASRISDRVPFGTGAAMKKVINGELQKTYAFELYQILKSFISQVESFYTSNPTELHPLLSAFLDDELEKRLVEIRNNSASFASFYKRFFSWFDIFKCIKFFHFARDRGYPDISVECSARALFAWIDPDNDYSSKQAYLEKLRHLDRFGLRN